MTTSIEGMPEGLHPATQSLVKRFALALAHKLHAAEQKYGYSDGWRSPDWMDECRQKLREHIDKGDPRDVAAYCAFLWHHEQGTALDTPATPVAPSITLTGAQIRNLLELVNPDGDDDEDQLETEATIQWMPERVSEEGGPMAAGYYAWITEYPEEGVFPLDVDPATGTEGALEIDITPPNPTTVAIVVAVIFAAIIAVCAVVSLSKKPDSAAAEQQRQADAAVGAQY